MVENERKRMRKYLLFGILVILLTGCASNKPKENDFDSQLKYGKELIEKKKYLKAQTVFQSLAVKASHTDMSDEVLFYLGESYFLNKEYLLAIAEFDRLTRRMGFSSYVEKARWRICESFVHESPKYYHDQKYTENAIDKLQEFMEDYPNSEYRVKAQETILDLRGKLAKKIYESGVLYMKLGAYDSAILVFEDIAVKYYDTDIIKDSMKRKIESYCKIKDVENAKEYFQTIKNELSEEDRTYLRDIISDTEEILNRNNE